MNDSENLLWDDDLDPDETYKNDEKRSIDLGEALAFVAKEPGWIGKLLILLGLGVMSSFGTVFPLIAGVLPLLPPDVIAELGQEFAFFQGRTFSYSPAYGFLGVALLVGILSGVVQLGYYIDVVRRVRTDDAVKLPAWDNFGQFLADGGRMIVAYGLYLLSTLVFLFFGGLVLSAIAMSGADAILALAGVCLFLPLGLIYSLTVIFLTSICVVPYSETGSLRDFFRVGWAWQQVRTHGKLTLTWFALGVAANMGFQAVQSLPVVGILGIFLALAMQAPVQGHLLGQYAALLDKFENKPKRNIADL